MPSPSPYLMLLLAHCVWTQIAGTAAENPDNAHEAPKNKDYDLESRPTPGIVLLYSKALKPERRPSLNKDGRIINDPHQRPDEDNNNNYNNYKQHNHHKHGATKPKCAHGQTYCLFDEDYPGDKVNEILNTYHDDIHAMYYGMNQYPLNDYIKHDNYTHGYRHKGHFVCESEVSYVRPGWAKNWKNDWVAVVNTDKYPQSMRIETCKYEGMKCEYLPPCYKSFCIQRYTYVKLLCVDPFNMHHRPIVDVFEIPSACSCFVENFVYY